MNIRILLVSTTLGLSSTFALAQTVDQVSACADCRTNPVVDERLITNSLGALSDKIVISVRLGGSALYTLDSRQPFEDDYKVVGFDAATGSKLFETPLWNHFPKVYITEVAVPRGAALSIVFQLVEEDLRYDDIIGKYTATLAAGKDYTAEAMWKSEKSYIEDTASAVQSCRGKGGNTSTREANYYGAIWTTCTTDNELVQLEMRRVR